MSRQRTPSEPPNTPVSSYLFPHMRSLIPTDFTHIDEGAS